MDGKDSKTNFALLRDKVLGQNGKTYWRSVEEFVDAPEFEEYVKQEYPVHAEEWDDTLSRRNFVKVMGASLAFAGLSGCVIQPAEKIVPYVRQPEGIIPGKPLFFATAMTLGGVGVGLLAKSNEGRPTKLEGNPAHPGSLGSTDIYAQASILEMYDPDRSKEITFRGTPRTWQNLMSEVRSAVDENRADGGAAVRFLSQTITSPTMIAQIEQLKAELPNAKFYQYEPVNRDNALAGAKLAFGAPAEAVYKFEKAERILMLDADILSGFNVRYIKDFSKGRSHSDEKKTINRLYAVETTATITGAKADHRLGVKPSEMPEVAKAIAAALGVSGASSTYKENSGWISAMAEDLQASRGKSVVVAGDNQSPVVHALAHAINAALGNVGQTVTYTDPFRPNAETTQTEMLRQLVTEIDNGAVKLLVILGGNPTYNTPSDLKLDEERMKKVGLRVHLGHHFNETAALCQWHISEKHFLEMWSDTRGYDGTVSIVQPLIEPLYDSKSGHEVVQLFFKENYDKKDYDIVREYWQKQGFAGAPNAAPAKAIPSVPVEKAAQEGGTPPKPAEAVSESSAAAPKPVPTPDGGSTPASGEEGAAAPKSFEDNWRKIVHDGVIPNSAAAEKSFAVTTGFLTEQTPSASAGEGELEISILPDPSVYDGRFTNNGWLQELPNPLTKITWENVAIISPNTAKRLGINQNKDYVDYAGGELGTTFINTKGGNLSSDLVDLKFQGGQIEKPVPMWVQPGQPDDVVTIYMGYGRSRAGKIGTGIGYNAFDVRRSDALWSGNGSIVKTGEQAQIASTQIHFNMEGRELALVYDVEEFEKHPEVVLTHDEYPKSMYTPFKYEGNKWGMTIDLNSCVGCNACVLACQSENNIPVVGKEQVERSREMHWMRVDAYYSGDDINDPDGPHFQPVLCQQCEQAPCETVCPVHATVHSAEGLNDMVYNRCVGTRYCSNNCPYKVRRFNFFLYQDWDTPQYKLMRNPEVTIRSRGVMEKCTYCTQRISNARIDAEKDGRKIRDGEILTACQSACPADAITFGDLNDAESKVAKTKKNHRNYNLLNELNTQPRTTYLAALKNQNKKMPDYKPAVIPAKKLEAHSEGTEEKSAETAH